MPASRLYVDSALAADTRITLPDAAARHVGRVLRCRPGDELTLFDGRGGEFAATVDEVSKRGVVVSVGGRRSHDVESPLALRLIQGVSRGDRMDTVVQKATELGVTRISPLVSERTVVRLDEERAEKRIAHWRRVAISACEQCGRNRLPQVDPPASLAEVLGAAPPAGSARLLLSPKARAGLGDPGRPRPATVELLIGPEGGFSAAEAALAGEAGFEGISLGPRVLRTETAAIAALALVQAAWGDLGPREQASAVDGLPADH